MPPLATKEYDDLRKEIGRRIYRKMIDIGWNQSRLAAEATKCYQRLFGEGRITRGNISEWVRGAAQPGSQRLEALAKALKTTPPELVPTEMVEVARKAAKTSKEGIEMVAIGNDAARVQFNRVLSWDIAMQIVSLVKEGTINGGGFDDPAVGGDDTREPANYNAVARRRTNKAVVSIAKRSR